MSEWTYINGAITVYPLGRTQSEKKYVLDTVLNHLPRVTGSEKDMDVYVIQKKGYNCSSSCDEFYQNTNNLTDRNGRKTRDGSMRTQEEYILVVNGSLRDRTFEEALKEFNKFICRLAKRVYMDDVLVSMRGWNNETIITNKNKVYSDMYVDPNYRDTTKEENWCQYLMWRYVD